MIKFNLKRRSQLKAVQISMGRKTIKINKSKLEKLYLENKYSVLEISRKLKRDQSIIKRELVRNNIILRSSSETVTLALAKNKIPKKVLENLYLSQKLTQQKISKKIGRSRQNVINLMKEYGIRTRPASKTLVKYTKYDFSGNLIEKSYLIGFRLGDLYVKLSDSKNLIIVSCTSTKTAQIKLFQNLFDRYGHIWIGKIRSDNNRVFLVRLNRSFDFLLPKKDAIPVWIIQNNKYFLPFLAGYTDAEGCIGVYNKIARYTLASYDKQILKQIHRCLIGIKVQSNPPKILVKAGHVKNSGLIYRKDHWYITIQKKIYLLMLLELLKPFIRHEKRLLDLNLAKENILGRTNNATCYLAFYSNNNQ